MDATADDRREIHELVLRYCRAVDRLDLPGIRAVYAEDGVDHHTGFSGSADDYVAWLGRMLPHLAGTSHLVGNHLSEVAGDEGVAETYGTATHWGAVTFTSGFRYVDHVVRTPEGWRVRERFAIREWERDDTGALRPAEGDGPRGTRDEDDPLRVLQQRVLGRTVLGR